MIEIVVEQMPRALNFGHTRWQLFEWRVIGNALEQLHGGPPNPSSFGWFCWDAQAGRWQGRGWGTRLTVGGVGALRPPWLGP